MLVGHCYGNASTHSSSPTLRIVSSVYCHFVRFRIWRLSYRLISPQFWFPVALHSAAWPGELEPALFTFSPVGHEHLNFPRKQRATVPTPLSLFYLFFSLFFYIQTVPFFSFPFLVFDSIRCMYNHLLDRRRDAVTVCVQLLRDYSRDMALDPRFYQHIGQSTGPGSISSATSSESSAVTSITTPSAISTFASAATLRSTASSPSLRARESISVPAGRQDGIASPAPGGNVRVVVRVRKFLPRGR